jgi:EAL domain-containing protein (putative c-di-GMP-specific phosphodiesterase class I)
MGNVGPADFIPIAEEAGLIQRVGEWVFENACRDIQKLNEKLGESFVVSINLSPYQIADKALLSMTKRVLLETRLSGDRVQAEITEGVLTQDSPIVTATLNGLRELGVSIAIDDFGTGFSNVSYLLRLSVDCLKIDRSIIRDCYDGSNSSAVTKAVIALAHQLKLSIIAEGVETTEQCEFLTSAGCDCVQGYYFYEPVPIDEIAEYALRNKAS